MLLSRCLPIHIELIPSLLFSWSMMWDSKLLTLRKLNLIYQKHTMLFQRVRAISVWAFWLRWKQSALKKERSGRPSCGSETLFINQSSIKGYRAILSGTWPLVQFADKLNTRIYVFWKRKRKTIVDLRLCTIITDSTNKIRLFMSGQSSALSLCFQSSKQTGYWLYLHIYCIDSDWFKYYHSILCRKINKHTSQDIDLFFYPLWII